MEERRRGATGGGSDGRGRRAETVCGVMSAGYSAVLDVSGQNVLSCGTYAVQRRWKAYTAVVGLKEDLVVVFFHVWTRGRRFVFVHVFVITHPPKLTSRFSSRTVCVFYR
jgi:hypothetical protein